MYNCIFHGWSSFERKCPDCFPLIYTTASTTEPSPPSADKEDELWDEVEKEFHLEGYLTELKQSYSITRKNNPTDKEG